MKFKRIHMIFAVIIVILMGCNLKITDQERNTPLTLTISLDKLAYQSGDPIPVLLSLKNTGDSDIIINGHMTANSWGAPKGDRVVAFKITNSLGETPPFLASINMRPTTKDDLITLSPGESLEKIYYIDQDNGLDKIGSYSMFAVYQNTISLDENKDIPWIGEVTSNTITFEVAR